MSHVDLKKYLYSLLQFSQFTVSLFNLKKYPLMLCFALPIYVPGGFHHLVYFMWFPGVKLINSWAIF